MTREEAKYCEECKYCQHIEKMTGYWVKCDQRYHIFNDPVIYCRYKKLKKEKKRKC